MWWNWSPFAWNRFQDRFDDASKENIQALINLKTKSSQVQKDVDFSGKITWVKPYDS